MRHHKHDEPGYEHIAAMVRKTATVVVAGRIHDEQACAGQQKNRKRQWPVKALKQRRGALEKRGFVKNCSHTPIICDRSRQHDSSHSIGRSKSTFHCNSI